MRAMPIYELAALGAATCWALTGVISVWPAGHLGAPAFNRLRQAFVTVLLAVYVVASGTWQQLGADNLWPLILSGLIGIFLGDTLLFAALNRLGPRRSGILFALNAPIAAVLGFVFLHEALPIQAIAGMALVLAGVVLAILFGRRQGQAHAWESVKGPLWIGVALGLGAATGQAVGSIIARPIMAAGMDPFAASLVRVAIAAFCLSVLIALPIPSVKPKGPVTWPVFALTALTGIIALAIGMTLLLFALSGGKVGIVSTLSATSPVLILPMIWLRTGERPAAGAWLGAALVVAGMGLLFVR
jgi:drug/metabolite transporter (DMT)-like permease